MLVFTLSCSQARAETFGLAMHGQTKYDANATHLDYANPDAPKGGTLKIAEIGTFDTLNPFSIKGKAAMGLNLVYDRLMARVWDEPFTMYPLIAERVEIPDDRSSITVHINPKARFHDGSPITADDVIFSFETLKAEGRPNMRQVYKLVETVEKRDEKTVHFTFGEGYDRETVMILTLMPVLSKTYWTDRTFDQTTIEPPLATGPYRIKNFEVGRYITYERVPDYWAADLLPNVGHNNFDEITYEYYRDDSVSFEAFASGDTDLRREGDIRKWFDAYDFPAVQNGEVIKEALPHSRPEKTRGLIFNTRRAPFDDIHVREALELLLDRYQINKTLFNHEKKFIASYFPNSEFEALAHVAPPENTPTDLRKNMRRASSLLKQAGWSIANGIQTKNDRPFSFELLLQHPEDEKLALHFQQNLKRLGIDMRVRVADSAQFIRRLQAYDYDMVLHHWQSSLSPGTEQLLYWGCEAAQQQGRFNYAGICTPEIDALAAKIAQTVSRDELVETMRTLDTRLLEGHYMIPLFYLGKDFVARKAAIRRPESTPLYGMVMETWWMETDGDNPDSSTNED
ncbi:MAG: ABC transporter substrate-binding protein [Rhodospirillales bacterium]|nr:ABC transporter substrate-binding protein [Rhodospirillales bacterium]